MGKWNNLKNIDLKEMSEEIGEEKASALLGFFFTSKFNGKSKAAC